MARRLNNLNQLNAYIGSVIIAANHHATTVNTVIPTLKRDVLARFNWASDKIEVYERGGQIARTCWLTLNSARYVFTYNYGTGQIDLKSQSIQGNTIASFQNSTPPANIASIIRNL